MKKGFLIFNILLTISIAYSCDKDNPDNTHYLDNKLIEGKWYHVIGEGLDSSIYTFKNNKVTYELYAHIIDLDTLKYEGLDDYGNYLLTDSLIILPKHPDLKFIYHLKNNGDSLYIQKLIDAPLYLGYKRVCKKIKE